MVQDFLTAWINWYYGNDPYPTEAYGNLTFEQKMEAMSKSSQIKKILGLSNGLKGS
jgi:hypothetical protein